ncbi:MAG: N-6 DNA methylase [Bdellovibrionota bacterium]
MDIFTQQLDLNLIERTQLHGEDIDNGTVFTPVKKAQALLISISKEIARKTKSGQRVTILEPTSGVGNLIVALYNNLKALNADFSKVQVFSNELNKSMFTQQKKILSGQAFKDLKITFSNRDYLFSSTFEDIDYVIMNSPWLGYKLIPAVLREKIKRNFHLFGQFDLLDAFVIKTANETKLGGKLCLFLPDKVLSTQVKGTCLNLLTDRITIERSVHLEENFFAEVSHASVYLEISNSPNTEKAKPAGKNQGTKISDVFELFRGIEISGRNSEWITENRLGSLDPSRKFLTGVDIGEDKQSTRPQRYLTRKTPKFLIKSQFEYTGPAILARKTGTPVEFKLVSKMPFFSQVVFAMVPKNKDLDLSAIYNFLKSNECKEQIDQLSGKQHRKLFPYITLSILGNIHIPEKFLKSINKMAA